MLRRRYLAEGWWDDRSLGEMVADGLGRMGDVEFRVHSKVRPWSGTFAEVDRSARALAGALRARGVGAGDVVVFQLPNWVEAGITFWAAAYLGAVVVPIVHFYGAKEVEYILRTTRPAVVVTADRFGHSDYLDHLRGAARRAPGGHLAGGRRHPTPGSSRPAPCAFADLLDGATPVDGPRRRRPRRARRSSASPRAPPVTRRA